MYMLPMGCQGNSTTPATHASLESEVHPAYVSMPGQGSCPPPTSTVTTTLVYAHVDFQPRKQQPPWIHATAAMDTCDYSRHEYLGSMCTLDSDAHQTKQGDKQYYEQCDKECIKQYHK